MELGSDSARYVDDVHIELNDGDELSSRTSHSTVGASDARSLRRPRREPRRGRTDWRLGGRAVSRWNKRVLVVSLGGAVFAIGAGLVARTLWPANSGSLSLLLTWLGLASAIVYAFARGRPAGLTRLRPVDLVLAVGLGVGLRLLQGVVSGTSSTAFPQPFSPTDLDFSSWLWGELLPAGLGGPVVEELFFRAVLLVSVFQALRRTLGYLSAGVTALLISAGSFVLLHSAFAPVALPEGIMLFSLGATCAGLVLLTGRIWGAVCLHIVYNVTFLLISLAGGLLA